MENINDINARKEMFTKEQEQFIEKLSESFGSDEGILEQQKKAAELLGVNPSDILVKKDVMATRYSQDGVLIKPHVGRVRFVMKLSERDLGLKATNSEHKKFFDEYVALGSKYLISRDYLLRAERIDGKVRRVVAKNGFNTRWGIFVPYSNMTDLRNEIDQLREDYFLIRDEIIANYDSVRIETIEAYRAAARHAYVMLEIDKNENAPSLEEYMKRFADMAMMGFPTKEIIYNSYYINLDLSFVPLASFVAEQKARIEMIKQRTAIYQKQLAALEAEAEIDNMEKQQILRQKLQADMAKQKAIEEAHKDAISGYKSQMESFLGDVVGQVYGLVYDAVNEVRGKVKMEGSMTGVEARMITNMIKKVERLNFTDNQEIKDFVGQLKELLEYPTTARDADMVMKTLNPIIADSKNKLMLLGCDQRTIRDDSAVQSPHEKVEIEVEIPQHNERVERVEQVENTSFFMETLFPEGLDGKIELRQS